MKDNREAINAEELKDVNGGRRLPWSPSGVETSIKGAILPSNMNDNREAINPEELKDVNGGGTIYGEINRVPGLMGSHESESGDNSGEGVQLVPYPRGTLQP